MTKGKRTVVGVFENREHAQQAVNELRRAGFREDQIGVASHGDKTMTGARDVADTDTNAGEGAAAGAVTGAALGGLWGLGVLAGVLPAIGPVIAGGTLAALAASAATGAAIAGLAGALIGLGVPEDEATYYEGEFKSGRTVVTVQADGRYDEAWTILTRHGAYDRTMGRTATTGKQFTQATTGTAAHAHTGAACATGTHLAGEKNVQLREEQLHARKQPVETGEVRVRKDVVTEHKTIDVPVTREEVVIERHPASGRATAGDIRPGEEVRIPVKEEQVRVEKETVVKEEVHVGKRKVQDTEKVSGTVRKEQLRVEKEGDVDIKDRGNTC